VTTFLRPDLRWPRAARNWRGCCRRHLGPPPGRIIDVGCGIGSYGRELVADGYDWLGVETRAADCAELARLGLPHRRVDGRTLPFADGAFESALCIEVLEHIRGPPALPRGGESRRPDG
jgi:2-polyprenyl-3-methyl-5-hydroxy-6-metoxy-1,4-benzoquinol methylase